MKDIVIATCSHHGMTGCEECVEGEAVRLKLFFEESARLGAVEYDLFSLPYISAVSVQPVIEEDWNKKWRDNMEPAQLAPGVWVSPVWLPPNLQDDEFWIKIEPKMAFGTGHHETTRLAAQAVIATAQLKTITRMLDIGTGSGVLTFCADLAGVKHCFGLEKDKACLENLAENRDANVADGSLQFLIGTVEAIAEDRLFDCVVMNMIYSRSAPILSAVKQHLDAEGVFVWSGILADEKHEALAAAAETGFSILKETQENEWWCGVFEK